jgi:hypothetical protein
MNGIRQFGRLPIFVAEPLALARKQVEVRSTVIVYSDQFAIHIVPGGMALGAHTRWLNLLLKEFLVRE